MPTLNFDIEIVCAECGDTLEAKSGRIENTIYIHPCESCTDSAYNEGVSDAKEGLDSDD